MPSSTMTPYKYHKDDTVASCEQAISMCDNDHINTSGLAGLAQLQNYQPFLDQRADMVYSNRNVGSIAKPHLIAIQTVALATDRLHLGRHLLIFQNSLFKSSSLCYHQALETHSLNW